MRPWCPWDGGVCVDPSEWSDGVWIVLTVAIVLLMAGLPIAELLSR